MVRMDHPFGGWHNGSNRTILPPNRKRRRPSVSEPKEQWHGNGNSGGGIGKESAKAAPCPEQRLHPASFIAGSSAAVILSDLGADVIKVEPPIGDLWRHGHRIPPQPQAKDAYPWHLVNRNKRGITLDLKSPSAGQVLERLVKWADVLVVNTPHPARKKLKLEHADVVQWKSRLIYADVTGFGEKGPDADLPGFDITSYWARSGLLSMTRDVGAPPTWPVAGSGDNANVIATDIAPDAETSLRRFVKAAWPAFRQALSEITQYESRRSGDRRAGRMTMLILVRA